uniref:Uncharacterized protein n=1 Tax=viral metagenome TaxID=1070528 RepID=A0A6C0AEM8_9ZZZZ
MFFFIWEGEVLNFFLKTQLLRSFFSLFKTYNF